MDLWMPDRYVHGGRGGHVYIYPDLRLKSFLAINPGA